MFRPVGSKPPSVYWRRRLLVIASAIVLVVLLALTLKTVFSGGGGNPSGQDGRTGSTTGGRTPTPGSPHETPTTRSPSGAKTTGRTSASTSRPPAKCQAHQLQVQAVVGKAQYRIGDQPVLTLQVTNSGPAPCVQDVADSQILLRVYNGASRVWGSHDCQTEPGVTEKTLPVDKPIGFSMTWSGLTAQPGCATTRQRVGAGTYTLYATLAGVNGKAAQFTIS
ncbi:MAG: hypothetical protein ACRDWT_15015 [Jatrophihabitantaceae bacterium]